VEVDALRAVRRVEPYGIIFDSPVVTFDRGAGIDQLEQLGISRVADERHWQQVTRLWEAISLDHDPEPDRRLRHGSGQ